LIASSENKLFLLGTRPFTTLMQIELNFDGSLRLLEDKLGKELVAVVNYGRVRILEVETFKNIYEYDVHIVPEDNARQTCCTLSSKHIAIGTDTAQV